MDDYQAYRETTFEAETPIGRIEVRVGRPAHKLDGLLQFFDAGEWAFVTAWNPGGAFAGEEENRRRQEALETRLEESDYPYFPGECVPDNADWAPEQCTLVVGMSEDEARELAEKFDQDSVLYGEFGQEARLIDVETGDDVTPYAEPDDDEVPGDDQMTELLDELGGTVDESVQQYRQEPPDSLDEMVDWEQVMDELYGEQGGEGGDRDS